MHHDGMTRADGVERAAQLRDLAGTPDERHAEAAGRAGGLRALVHRSRRVERGQNCWPFRPGVRFRMQEPEDETIEHLRHDEPALPQRNGR